MDRSEANACLCAILETLHEIPEGVPSGHMYAALMGRTSLEEYEALLEIAKRGGLVDVKSHLVTITSKGRDMVAKIQAHVAKQVQP